MSEPLTENELDRLLHAPSVDDFLDQQETTERSLADYLSGLLAAKVLQIAFAMALSLRETNRALRAAGTNELNAKCRRDAIIIFCLDRGCSLQKVNEELYRFGEETVC